jgi:tetratricopeptide (TPR) repeat protein
MADYNEAIRVNPTHFLPFSNRGLIYLDKKDFDRAIADFNEAIRLNPNDYSSLYNRGLAKEHLGDKSGAADITNACQSDRKIAATGRACTNPN